MANQKGTSSIDFINHEITFRYFDSIDATALAPVISISEGAIIDPASETAQDFTASESTPVIYTVTAEDGITTQDWAVRAIPIGSQTDIVSFEIPATVDIIEAVTIDAVNHVVNIVMLPTQTLRFVQPEIGISTRATISLVSGNLIDLSSNTFTYQVTAVDWASEQAWTVTVETPLNTSTDFLSFAISGQIGASKIDTAAHQINVSFPEGVALAALTPTFTLSGGATSSPVSGLEMTFQAR